MDFLGDNVQYVIESYSLRMIYRILCIVLG